MVEMASSPSEVLPCSGASVRSWLSRARSIAVSRRARMRSSMPVDRITGAPTTDSATTLWRWEKSVRTRSKRACDHPLHQHHGDQQHDGKHEHRDGELPAVGEQHPGRHDQLRTVGDELDTAALEERRHLVDVAGEARDEVGTRHPVGRGRGHVVDPAQAAATQVGQGGLDPVLQASVEGQRRRRGDDDGHQPDEHRPLDRDRGERAVDGVLDGQRRDDPSGAGEEREHHGHDQPVDQDRRAAHGDRDQPPRSDAGEVGEPVGPQPGLTTRAAAHRAPSALRRTP